MIYRSKGGSRNSNSVGTDDWTRDGESVTGAAVVGAVVGDADTGFRVGILVGDAVTGLGVTGMGVTGMAVVGNGVGGREVGANVVGAIVVGTPDGAVVVVAASAAFKDGTTELDFVVGVDAGGDDAVGNVTPEEIGTAVSSTIVTLPGVSVQGPQKSPFPNKYVRPSAVVHSAVGTPDVWDPLISQNS